MALKQLVGLLNTLDSRKPLSDLKEKVLKREEFLVPWIEYRDEFLMHIREKIGGNKRSSCKIMAKLFNNELELGRASKYIANGRNPLDKTGWRWNDYHLRLYVSLAENFEADEQLSKILRDDIFSFIFHLVRYLRELYKPYGANWRKKLAPLARFIEKESWRFSSSYHQKPGQSSASKSSKRGQVTGKSKYMDSRTTQPLNAPSRSQDRRTQLSSPLNPKKRKAPLTIKLSDDESDAAVTGSSRDDIPKALRTRISRPKNRTLANTADAEGDFLTAEASIDGGSRLTSIDPEDIEQLRAAYSPAGNVANEDPTDNDSETSYCPASSLLGYVNLKQLANPLLDEPPVQTDTMVTDYILMLYDEQYKIAKYQQKVDGGRSDDRLAWRLRQRNWNYEFMRMELIRLHDRELEPGLAAEFPRIDEDNGGVIDLTFDGDEDMDGEYEMFGETVPKAVSMGM